MCCGLILEVVKTNPTFLSMQSAIASEQKNLKDLCSFMHLLDATKLRSLQTVGKKHVEHMA